MSWLGSRVLDVKVRPHITRIPATGAVDQLQERIRLGDRIVADVDKVVRAAPPRLAVALPRQGLRERPIRSEPRWISRVIRTFGRLEPHTRPRGTRGDQLSQIRSTTEIVRIQVDYEWVHNALPVRPPNMTR